MLIKKKNNLILSLLFINLISISLLLIACGNNIEKKNPVNIPIVFVNSKNQKLKENNKNNFKLTNALVITSYTITNSDCITTSTNTNYTDEAIGFVLGDTGCKSKLTALTVNGNSLTVTVDFPTALTANQTALFTTGELEYHIVFKTDTRSGTTAAVESGDTITYEISEATDENAGTAGRSSVTVAPSTTGQAAPAFSFVAGEIGSTNSIFDLAYECQIAAAGPNTDIGRTCSGDLIAGMKIRILEEGSGLDVNWGTEAEPNEINSFFSGANSETGESYTIVATDVVLSGQDCSDTNATMGASQTWNQDGFCASITAETGTAPVENDIYWVCFHNTIFTADPVGALCSKLTIPAL